MILGRSQHVSAYEVPLCQSGFPSAPCFKNDPDGIDWPVPSLLEEECELDPARRVSPAAAPVHVLAGSALVRVKEQTLIVERPDEPVFERPIELVSALHIHGWAGITSPAIAALLAQDTPVVWRGATGYPIGCSRPLHSPGVEARRAQYNESDRARGLQIAKAFVIAKIINMRGVVRRKATLRGRERLAPMARAIKSARSARDLKQLLGIEGAATAHYFASWPDLISDRAGDLEWNGRNRRPPPAARHHQCHVVLCLCARSWRMPLCRGGGGA